MLVTLFCRSLFLGNITCPAGSLGQGGQCDCRWSPGWNQFDWETKCDEGTCYAVQDYDWCVGKDQWTPIGDGTFCIENKRRTHCFTITEITTPGSEGVSISKKRF